MTNIICTRCDKKMNEFDPKSPLATKWCRKCDKHFSRCKCEVPELFVVLGGVDVTCQFPQVDLSKR